MTDSPTGSPGFDPRFDPAFQPGYRPETDPRPAQRSTRSAQPTPAPSAVRTAPTDPKVESQSTSATHVEPIIVEGAPATASVPRTPAQTIRAVNPYLLVLWVLSIAFIIVGIVLLGTGNSLLAQLTKSGGGTISDYYLIDVYKTAAPIAIALGVATATGTVFLLAAWRRKV